MMNKFTLTILLCLPYFALAQQMQTDRPNETEGPNALASHHLQIENGFSFEQKNGEKTYEVPETVIRYGLFKNTEFRIESAFKILNEQDHTVLGIKPVLAGFKYHLIDHTGAVPDVGILGRISIPWLADNAYKEKNYSPEIRLLVQHELSKSSHLGYNLGIHWIPENVQPEYIYTLSADHSITKKIKLFVETYGFALPHQHTENNADTGILFVVTSNLQLDLMAGTGLMHAHSDKFAEIGLSFRI